MPNWPYGNEHTWIRTSTPDDIRRLGVICDSLKLPNLPASLCGLDGQPVFSMTKDGDVTVYLGAELYGVKVRSVKVESISRSKNSGGPRL